jgi:hypothetical protein
MSMVVDFKPVMRVTESIDSADAIFAVGVGSTSLGFDLPANGRFASTDTPAPTKSGGNEYTLDSGTPTTIDLTAIPSLMNTGVNATFNGLQVLFLKIVCDPTNTGTVTLEPGAADSYLLFGTAFKIILQPGACIMLGIVKKTDGTMPAWGLPDVDATHKNIKVSTSVTGSKIDFMVVAG